ncbi:MAG: di-trans,poly-cis-decaprenylcistransferase [Clostridiales bacterium]|nr:di-trans,poly-cis-decaprenylcistransferase [Candidatus Apopatousia equi]
MSIFNRNKKQKLNLDNLPNHIGFIIDGNGRWAKKRGLPRTLGHREGVVRVKETVNNCFELGIKEVSFFCFSTENWNRPKDEVDALFNMLRDFIHEDIEPYKNKGIKFVVSGDILKLPQDLQDAIVKAVNDTKSCKNMVVNLCINYGGRTDILRVVNSLIKENKNEVSLQDFEEELYSNNFHELDFVVRTSGEQRISNFMLYQMAYAELYFTKTYWPDFDRKELELALIDYQSRNRRFGKIEG